MKRVCIHAAILWLGGFVLATAAGAQSETIIGNADDGAAKAATCAACHGADGNSVNPQWPKLAGQGAGYLAKQLYNFQAGEDGGRNNALMVSQAVGLDDQDIADLAAYYAQQKMTPGVADPALAARGEALYRGGDPERGIPACSGCHSPSGGGNAAAKFPRLNAQHDEYLRLQLHAFRAGERANDPNEMMRGVAANLSDDDIAALSAYLQGLRQ